MFGHRHGIRAVAILTAEAPDTGGFEIIALGLDRPSSKSKTRSPTPERAEMRLLWLAGGVTASWLQHQFADWFEEQRRDKRKAASWLARSGAEDVKERSLTPPLPLRTQIVGSYPAGAPAPRASDCFKVARVTACSAGLGNPGQEHSTSCPSLTASV